MASSGGRRREKSLGMEGDGEESEAFRGGWYRERLSQVLYSQSRGGMGSGEVTSQVSPEIPVTHLLPALAFSPERSLHRSPRAGISFVLSQNKPALKPVRSSHFHPCPQPTSSTPGALTCYLSAWHGHQFGLGQSTVSPEDFPDMLSAMGSRPVTAFLNVHERTTRPDGMLIIWRR